MVDNVNPNSQFHPYVPQTATPQTGNTPASTGLGGILSKLGIDQSKIGALGSGSLGNVRTMAQKNPNLVLGGLAALAIGAGLMRKRSMSRGI
jgi:LPXTG-motif cell wall-anchored protein